jgi:hypothetical protein
VTHQRREAKTDWSLRIFIFLTITAPMKAENYPQQQLDFQSYRAVLTYIVIESNGKDILGIHNSDQKPHNLKV